MDQLELALYDREGLIVDELLGSCLVSHTRFSPVNGMQETWLSVQSVGRPTAAQAAASEGTNGPEVCITVQYIGGEERSAIDSAQKVKTEIHQRRKEMKKLFNIEEEYLYDFSCNLDGSKIPGSGRVYITATQLMYNSTFKQKIIDLEDIRGIEKYKTMLLSNAGITLLLKNGRKIHLKSFKHRKAFLSALQLQVKLLDLPPIPIVDRGSSDEAVGEQEEEDDSELPVSSAKNASFAVDTSAGTSSPPPSYSQPLPGSSNALSNEPASLHVSPPSSSHIRTASGKLRDSSGHLLSNDTPTPSSNPSGPDAKPEKTHKESHRRTPSAVAASMFRSVSDKLRNISTSSGNISKTDSKGGGDSRSETPTHFNAALVSPSSSSHIQLAHSSDTNSSGGVMGTPSSATHLKDASSSTPIPLVATHSSNTSIPVLQHASSGSGGSAGSTGGVLGSPNSNAFALSATTGAIPSSPLLQATHHNSMSSSTNTASPPPPSKAPKEKSSLFGAPAFLKDLSLPFHLPGSKRKRAASAAQNVEGSGTANDGNQTSSSSSSDEESDFDSDREREQSRRLKYYLIHGEVPAGSGEEESEIETRRRSKVPQLRQASIAITRSSAPMDDDDDEDTSERPSTRTRQKPKEETSTSSTSHSSGHTPMLSVRSFASVEDEFARDRELALEGGSSTHDPHKKQKSSSTGSSSSGSATSSPRTYLQPRAEPVATMFDVNAQHTVAPADAITSQHAPTPSHPLLLHNLHASAPPTPWNQAPQSHTDDLDVQDDAISQNKSSLSKSRLTPTLMPNLALSPNQKRGHERQDSTSHGLGPQSARSVPTGTSQSAMQLGTGLHHHAISDPAQTPHSARSIAPLLSQTYSYSSTAYGGALEEDSISDSIAGSADQSSHSPVRSRRQVSQSTSGATNDTLPRKKQKQAASSSSLRRPPSSSSKSHKHSSSGSHGSKSKGRKGYSNTPERDTLGASSSSLNSGRKSRRSKRSPSTRLGSLVLKTGAFGFILALAILLRANATLPASATSERATLNAAPPKSRVWELINLAIIAALGTITSQVLSVLFSPRLVLPTLASREMGAFFKNPLVQEHLVPFLVLVTGHCVLLCFGLALLLAAHLFGPDQSLQFVKTHAGVLLLRVHTCLLYVLFSSVGCHLIARQQDASNG